MPRYSIDGETLDGLADAIRSVTGATVKYTPTEMIEEVRNILNAATFVLVDADGNEYTAAYLDSDYLCTAKEDDIRIGTTAITADGFTTGTKEIPNYRAVEGCEMIEPGEPLNIYLFSDMCEYTTLQSIVCEYNTTLNNSVSAAKVIIKDAVYSVGTTTALATVTVESTTQTIVLGITNDSEKSVVIRYMIIKEDE